MLERATPSDLWYARCPLGLLAAAVGAAALVTGYWSQFATGAAVPTIGSPAIFLPFLGVTILLAVLSRVRRERPAGPLIVGVAMAVAAPIVGWVVLVAAVAAVAVAVLLVIAKFH